MVPGEYFLQDGVVELNAGREPISLRVANTGDRPIQVGSHTHFFEVNAALEFDRDAGARPAARRPRRHVAAVRAGRVARRHAHSRWPDAASRSA